MSKEELCPGCMCYPPCICDKYETVNEMRKYYEANRRNWWRSEPKAIRSWGIKVDVLMEELYGLAIKKFRDEIYRLRKELYELRKKKDEG